MIKITKQILGNDKIIVKVVGDTRKEVIQHFFYFVNYGNCIRLRQYILDDEYSSDIQDDTGLTWLDITETSGYFRTKRKDLIQTLINISLFEILKKYPEVDEIPQPVLEQATKIGLDKYENIPEENILNGGLEIEG